VLDEGRVVATGDHSSLQNHLAYRRLMDAGAAAGDPMHVSAGWQG
jgi:hypothetical protein